MEKQVASPPTPQLRTCQATSPSVGGTPAYVHLAHQHAGAGSAARAGIVRAPIVVAGPAPSIARFVVGPALSVARPATCGARRNTGQLLPPCGLARSQGAKFALQFPNLPCQLRHAEPKGRGALRFHSPPVLAHRCLPARPAARSGPVVAPPSAPLTERGRPCAEPAHGGVGGRAGLVG